MFYCEKCGRGFKEYRGLNSHKRWCGKNIKLSEEHKRKIGLANKGKQHPHLWKKKRFYCEDCGKLLKAVYKKGKTGRCNRCAQKYNPLPTKEVIEKRAESNRGKKRSKETCRKISESNKGTERPCIAGEKNPFYGKTHSKKALQKINERLKKKWADPNSIYNTEEFRKRRAKAIANSTMPKTIKKKWEEDKAYQQKMFVAQRRKPSGLEKKMMVLLKEIDLLDWEYTGDGRFRIGGKNPDFINKKTKQIIEVNGGPGYYHFQDESEKRIKFYEKRGYKVLIVWEKELLKKSNIIKNKIIKFVGLMEAIMSQKKLKKLESCDPRVAAEVDKVFKEIDGPAIPEDCKYPELWYKCTEDLRERNEEVTLAKVKSSYNKLLKEITEKKASFIGNTIIPELDHLMHVKRIDINDKRRTIEEFKRAGLGSVARYLEMVSPGEYKALVDLVKTSKKADRIGKKWDDMGFSQREKILTAVGYGNMAYQLAANSWNTLPQYVIDSVKQRLAKNKQGDAAWQI